MRPIVRRPRSTSPDRQGRAADDLSGKLRALRTKQGLTLEDLARSVGLSKSALSQIESDVIRGRIEVFFGGSTYVLGPGDSIFFHASAPHHVVNAGRSTAVTIWAIAPPTY